ncbi:NADH-quinone oxidoreductase subunit D [Aestuariimicrobium soli]|uniref:NADH-quinone oxidoreductase subunit D-related protein n=1 Tax=Aestuariimicrobium soli TaxID=2035834 RepID=UPI003EBB49F4
MVYLELGSLAQAGGPDPDRVVTDLGPEHPTRAGLVRIAVELDHQGLITQVDIQPGFLHRGAEKLFEVRDYRQVLMLADRHDWQAPFFGELGVALACENLLGLAPPARATVLRTLLAEVARIHSHLGFCTFVPFHQRRDDLASLVRRARDETRTLMLAWTGNRLHPMLNRLGGLATDAPEGWFDRLDAWLVLVDETTRALAEAVGDEQWRADTAVGTLTREVAAGYGVTGPAARSALGNGGTGTTTARFDEWVRELGQSSAQVRRSADEARTTTGPVNVPLSKIIKLPDAEAWTEIEAPQGIAGFHLVSRGGTTPWRLALRTPTFANVNVLHALLVGCRLDQVGIVVAGLGWTIGDLDK